MEEGAGKRCSECGITALVRRLRTSDSAHTNGLEDLNPNGPSKVLTLAGDGFTHETSRDTQEAAKVVRQQGLDSVFQWRHDTGSLINPNKAQTQLHTGSLISPNMAQTQLHTGSHINARKAQTQLHTGFLISPNKAQTQLHTGSHNNPKKAQTLRFTLNIMSLQQQAKRCQ